MYRLAAIAVALSAIMHLAAVVLGKLAADVQLLVVVALLYLLFAFFLLKKKRWAAWLTFIVMLVGMTAALMNVNSGSYAPNWVFYAISVLDLIATICLIGVLWNPKMPINRHRTGQTKSFG